LAPATWGVPYRYTPDAVPVALGYEFHDPADYIRYYDEFLALARQHDDSTR
jgi:hypothetical protein